MAIYPQSGLARETALMDHSQTNFVRGIMRGNYSNLFYMSPFQSGRHHFIFLKMASFMEAKFPELTKTFKNIVEKFQTKFEGIQDMSANFGEMEGGSASNKLSYVTNVEQQFEEFTIGVPYDLHRLPLLEYLELWLSGISDPITKITHYHGLMGSSQFPTPNIAYEVAEALYILTDRGGIPIRAGMIYGIIPAKAHDGQLNSDKTNTEAQQLDLTFRGIWRSSADINNLSLQVVKGIKMTVNYLEYKYRDKFPIPDNDQIKYGN